MKHRYIKDNRSNHAIEKMCRVLGVSRSGYYKHVNAPDSQRDRENAMLLNQIKIAYADNEGNYGSPRISQELNDKGITCGKNRVARLMRKNEIRAKTSKKFRITTDSAHKHPVAPNRLAQEFSADTINQKWVSDITYIYTQEGWLYLAVIMDLCSRKIVGWAMESRITKKLTMKALQQAMNRRCIKAGLILHSDRGSQYACHDYVHLVKSNQFIQSMSGRGNCYDNAVMESFFKTLKVEKVYWKRYTTRDDARKSIFKYIECYYNVKRKHSALGYKSPQGFEDAMNFSTTGVY